MFEAQDHVGGRTSQVLKEGFNLGSGALFLMGGIYPRTNAILKELSRYHELVRWDATTEVIDADGRRYTAKFDQVMSFRGCRCCLGRTSCGSRPGWPSSWSPRGQSCGLTPPSWLAMTPGESGDLVAAGAGRAGPQLHHGAVHGLPLRGANELAVPALFHAVIKQFYRLSLSVPPAGHGADLRLAHRGQPRAGAAAAALVEQITKSTPATRWRRLARRTRWTR